MSKTHCPICDGSLVSGEHCVSPRNDHYFSLSLIPNAEYYRWTVNGQHYRVFVCTDHVEVNAGSHTNSDRIVVSQFEFNPKDPLSVMARINLLRAYR